MTQTESKWAERIQEWKSSGQSADDFARGREFKASTLRWWAGRFGRGAVGQAASSKATAAKGSVRIARVVSSKKADTLTVRVGGALVEVRTGFDHGLLRELVAVLTGGQ
jgi:hypothetical protein